MFRIDRTPSKALHAGLSDYVGRSSSVSALLTLSLASSERNSALGGVWANNRYPGVACDIPSALYSFSFGQQHWGRLARPFEPGKLSLTLDSEDLFSTGDKIQAYIEQTAYLNHLEGNIRLDTTVTDAVWSDDQNSWTIITHSKVGGRREYTSKILISAVGNLTIPVGDSFDLIGLC